MRYRLELIKKFRPLLNRGRGEILLLLLIGLAAAPLSLLSPKLFQILVDRVLQGGEAALLGWVALGLLANWALQTGLGALELYTGNRLQGRFIRRLRMEVWTRILHLDYRRLEKERSSDLKMRLADDTQRAGGFFKEQVSDTFAGVIVIGVQLVFCLWVQPALTLICLSIIPALMLVNRRIGEGARRVNDQVRGVHDRYCAYERQSLELWREIRLQRAEALFLEGFQAYRQTLSRLGFRNIRYWLFSEVFADFKANYLGRVWVYAVGAFFIITGQASIGELLMLAQCYELLFNACSQMQDRSRVLRENEPYYSRILQLLEEPLPALSPAASSVTPPAVSPGLSHDPSPVPSTGPFSNLAETGGQEKGLEVELRQAGFGYTPDRRVLREADMRLPAGSRTVLAGRSGCGKTTAAGLLLGLYRPEGGQVLWDGRPAADYRAADGRRPAAAVYQNSRLFAGTVRENLSIANPGVSERQLWRVCELVGLAPLLRTRPQGLDGRLDENGGGLSGGQRQRLCIARALLARPGFLLLDEATSALDEQGERQVLQAVRTLLPHATLLIVSHRSSLIEQTRRVFTLEDGRIRREPCGEQSKTDDNKGRTPSYSQRG
ncbi:MAG: ABC transporter ATP-binding protein [Clostridiales bacterium]|nr:ABC transporter ATP-binding protein [Clostridiales bacterium]